MMKYAYALAAMAALSTPAFAANSLSSLPPIAGRSPTTTSRMSTTRDRVRSARLTMCLLIRPAR